MIVNRENLIQKLKKVYPFNLAEDDQLSTFTGKTEVVFFKAGDMIFNEGAGARFLYIIFEGEVEIIKEENRKITRKNHIWEGDLFGEDIFLGSHVRQSGARAVTDCLLVRTGLAGITRFFQRNPAVSAAMKPLIQSYQLLLKSKQQFDLEGESICYIGQPHKLFLIVKSTAVLLMAGLFGAGALALSANNLLPAVAAGWFTGILAGAYLVWLSWNLYEWANDLYILHRPACDQPGARDPVV